MKVRTRFGKSGLFISVRDLIMALYEVREQRPKDSEALNYIIGLLKQLKEPGSD
jgi:hypothetical protein